MLRGIALTIAGMCIVLAGGCAKQADLALKFSPSDVTTYKAATETVKDYKFEQPSINQTKVQQTVNSAEVTFDQKIQSVDPAGNATAQITIKQVKYLVKNPQGTMVDIDTAKNPSSPLTKLVGQSYTIKLAPDGNVVAVSNTQAALDAVKGDSTESKVAQSLLSDDSIKQRHTVALPSKDQLAVGKSWTKLKGSPVGMPMPKSYEKVYTLKQIGTEGGKPVAIVDMTAHPTSAKAADMPKDAQQGMSFFAKMFDNKETYNGQMVLNLASGKIEKYQETLKSDYVATEPAEEVKSDKGPDVLTMGFSYTHSLQEVK